MPSHVACVDLDLGGDHTSSSRVFHISRQATAVTTGRIVVMYFDCVSVFNTRTFQSFLRWAALCEADVLLNRSPGVAAWLRRSAVYCGAWSMLGASQSLTHVARHVHLNFIPQFSLSNPPTCPLRSSLHISKTSYIAVTHPSRPVS